MKLTPRTTLIGLPDDWGLALPFSNVPAFICAKTLAGAVVVEVLLEKEIGGTGGGIAIALLNGDCANTPVGSGKNQTKVDVIQNVEDILG